MSNKIIIGGLATVLLALLGLNNHLVQAEDRLPPSQSQLDHIKTTCVEAQTTLRQIRSSDTLLRVNQGQRYEQMATKLMAPMNSRIALNQFDGDDLLSTTATYGKELNDFREAFRAYDKSISKAIDIDCKDSPREFYETVSTARENRQRLNGKVHTLNDLLKQYRSQFVEFAGSIGKESGE